MPAFPPEWLDRSVSRDAIAERDHGEVERRLDAIHNAPDGRHPNLKQFERCWLEGHSAGENRRAGLRFRIGHRAVATCAAGARFRSKR
jgi:hypothetical protein